MPKKKNLKKIVKRYGGRCLGKGLIIDNDTRKTGLNNNDLIIGGSGTGKSGSIGHPQLVSLSDSSLIMVDTKGQFKRMFSDDLEKRGYKVLTLDFVNPEESCLYNPLDYVRRDESGGCNEVDITKISRALIPDNLDDENFWPSSARAVLDFFIGYCLEALPEEDHNMYTVGRLYRMFTKDMGETAFMEWIESHRGSFVANRYAQIKNVQTAEKTMSSIYAFVNTAMFPFDIKVLHNIFDPGNGSSSLDDNVPDFDDTDFFDDDFFNELDEICEQMDDEDIDEMISECVACDEPEELPKRQKLDLASLGHEKTVLFLNISDNDRTMDGLVNLFYTQALQTLISEADKQENGQLPVPCRIIFDDFAAGTVIPDYDKIISVVRSRDIWLTICIQSMSQLESLYSHSQALTIINNCDHIVYLGCNDTDTATFIGTRAGKTPEAILAMDRSKEYFIEGGRMAVLRDKVPPYSYVATDDLQAS